MNLRPYLLVSGVHQENERARQVQDFFVLPQGFRSFLTVFSQARWRNLERIECRWLTQWWLVFVLLEVDATLGDECEIWEHLHSYRDVKCLQDYSKTFRMESFTSDLLQIIISYWTKSHLQSCQIFMMELFCKNSQWSKDLGNSHKKASPHMFV